MSKFIRVKVSDSTHLINIDHIIELYRVVTAKYGKSYYVSISGLDSESNPNYKIEQTDYHALWEELEKL